MKFHSKLNIFTQENAFENVAYAMTVILFRSQYVQRKPCSREPGRCFDINVPSYHMNSYYKGETVS